jgi:hypothetical protein
MAYVIYNEQDGIFLGAFLGLGFWSKLDSAGQDHAATFESAEDAQTFMSTWADGPRADVLFVEVEPDNRTHASVAACVRAGLPGWLDAATPSANHLPA